MIVKGVRGKIVDVDPETGAAGASSLVVSPDKWTMRDTFGTPEPGDTAQLGALSNWLVDYCLAAWAKREDPYFSNFAKIITDENWTGVLILKATVADVPTDLAGILAGRRTRTTSTPTISGSRSARSTGVRCSRPTPRRCSA